MNVKIKRSTVTLLLMSCCLLNHTSVTYADGFIGAVKTVGAVENALGVGNHKKSGSSSHAVSTVNQKHAHPILTDNEKLFLLGVEKHDTETVQAMLDVGVDINGVYGTNKQGTTALQIALKAYDLDMMQFLLERGADVNGYYRLDGKYVSYLVQAAATRDEVEILKYLHDWGADINSKEYPSGANALNGTFDCVNTFMGTKHNAMAKAAYLVEQGIDLENVPKKYYRSGGTINSEVFGKGRTPFLGAVAWNWPEMIELLANNGANINATDINGKNALQLALDKKDLQLYKFVQGIMEQGQHSSAVNSPKANTPSKQTIDKSMRLREYNSFIKMLGKVNDNQYNVIKEMHDLTKNRQQTSAEEKSRKLTALAREIEKNIPLTNIDSLLDGFNNCTAEDKKELLALAELRRNSLEKHAEALHLMAQNKELSETETEHLSELLQEVFSLNDSYIDKVRQVNKHFGI